MLSMNSCVVMLDLSSRANTSPASNASPMKPPLPQDIFPRRIETARLVLRSPESDRRALYARQAREACTEPEALTDDRADAFANFMIGHWERYGFGFLILHAFEGPGNLTP